MVYKKEAWETAIKTAVKDLNTDKPTAGKVCAIASLRYLRDGLIADHTKADGTKVEFTEESIRESFRELIKSVSKDGADSGFLSNASAAAKAAGYKSESAAVSELAD